MIKNIENHLKTDIYAIERDEYDGHPVSISGYKLIACNDDIAICAVTAINGNSSYDYIRDDLIENTYQESYVSLYVFPIDDIYITSDEAEAVLKNDCD